MSNKPTEAQISKARELCMTSVPVDCGFNCRFEGRYPGCDTCPEAEIAIAQALADAVAEERKRTLVVTDVSDRGAAAAIMAMWRLFRGDEKLFEETLAQQLAHAANRGRAEERKRCHECIQSVLEVADMIHDSGYVDAVLDMHHAFDYEEKP